MRALAAIPAILALSAAPAMAQNGQSEIYVPPPPTIVPAKSAPAPAPTPAPAPPPPGLIQTPLPPVSSTTATATAAPPTTPNEGTNAAPAAVGSNMAAPSPAAGTPAANGATGTEPPPDIAPPTPNKWVPGKTAMLGVLNEVDGSTSTVSIPVGGQAKVGNLTVSVQACMIRPPDELPDAAIFLTVQTGDNSAAPLYRGWMLRSAPGATVVGDASETFRAINCS